MVRQFAALALLGGGAWWLLSRQGSGRAFGQTGVPYRPDYSLGAFDEWGGIPYSPEEQARREDMSLDDGTLDLDLGWLSDDWLGGNDNDGGGSVFDLINGTGDYLGMTQPRGIRNHNPGNIKDTGTNWQGLDQPRNDGTFLRFTDPVYGIRAMARILDTYQSRHGLNTVTGIIHRWSATDQGSYTRYVADRLGVMPDERIDVDAYKPQLIDAMITLENGEQPYPMALIEEGVSLA